MRYKIKDIPSDGLADSQELSRAQLADALEGMDANLDASTANVRVQLDKDRDDNVFVRGDLKALVTVPCASCLGPALVKIDTPLKMTFVPQGDLVEENGDPLDDEEVATHDHEYVDLDPILREQIILGVPMSVHCREGCKGLCSQCGQNLNERDCGHKPASLDDERFAALKNLKLT